MSNVYIRGDLHCQFRCLKDFCKKMNTSIEDTLILLGDVGINLYGDSRDEGNKKFLSKLPITLFCIRGNHEARPSEFNCYTKVYVPRFACFCWWDNHYPNIYFPEDGACYIEGNRCLVAGGAYSVDKFYRLARGWYWNPQEQMTEKEKQNILNLVQMTPKFNYVFSHTAPLRFEPTFMFLSGIDQSKVDKSMENFLDEVYERIDKSVLKTWFFGHYHGNHTFNEKVKMLFDGYDVLK